MKTFWFTDGDERELLLPELSQEYPIELIDNDQLSSSILDVDYLLVNANSGKNERTQRSGLQWLHRARREYRLSAHAIVYSFESYQTLCNEYPILKTKGVSYLRLPFSPQELNQFLELRLRPHLTEIELSNIVRWNCGLQKEWRSFSHRLGNLISDHQKHHDEIQRLVADWEESIDRFAPDQKDNLESLQHLLTQPGRSLNTVELRRALERLDDGLQVGPQATSDPFPEVYSQPPKRPPKGYSKVLIADDEPQGFLINSLRNQYGYNVLEQAKALSQAKELLNKERPDVVLSDYYFKESSRRSEIPDKSIGDRFIHYALTCPNYAETYPKKPIVLVTSKATLRTETEIRKGAINCSGANRATDPMFIHGVIWEEARRRGVSEPEGQDWTLEHTCRQILEQSMEDLPKLIKQWGEFKGTLCDTLRLCRLLSKSASNDDPEIVNRVINALEPHETIDSFSLDAVVTIFAETERAHRNAQSPPDSHSKQAIRNILHGKLEQFSSVSNAAKFLINTLPDVARDLVSLLPHQQTGQKLYDALEEHSHAEPLLPLLTLLNETLAKALSDLPQVPVSLPSSRPKRVEIDCNAIDIVVVEDNEYWSDYVISAVKKTQSILGENFSISYRHFDNAADALASIPSTSKSFAIDGRDRSETKTIAIVDISLPQNKEHAERIRAALEGKTEELATPNSTHGLNLIRSLGSYNYNVPLIVFSTIDSIRDRKTIGPWGVLDDDFLAKGVDGENALVRALIRKIEKKTKYVIRRFEDKDGDSTFWINGVIIPFTKELGGTFSALYNLCQRTGKREFTVSEITEERGASSSEESKKAIQDQMYRIRNLILKTLQSNRVYVNVRELIRTRRSSSDEYTYQLNAQVTNVGEEEDYEIDLQQYENDVCRVLVIENNPQTLREIVESLESFGYEVKYATNVEDAVRVANNFLPHVISLDLQIPRSRGEAQSSEGIGEEFAGLDAWKQIRRALSSNTIGIVVPTINADKSHLVAKAAQMEIPIRNFVSKSAANWLNLLLKKVADEKRRVFLGEVTDASQDISEPVVKILDGSQLSEGVLYLKVNNEPFTMNKSPIAKIIGLLLLGPKTLLSFETIKTALGSVDSVTKDDSKNWTKRIRAVIKEKWLKSSQGDLQDLEKKILESSVLGLRLNVHVIDSRRK